MKRNIPAREREEEQCAATKILCQPKEIKMQNKFAEKTRRMEKHKEDSRKKLER